MRWTTTPYLYTMMICKSITYSRLKNCRIKRTRNKEANSMNEKESKKGLTRRGFIKGAALGVGATTMFAGFDPKDVVAKVPEKWDVMADIVVVGAGGAGLAAATE